MLKVNEKAPLFVLQDDQGGQFSLAEQAGQRLLLVFYPGDNTPVCTKQLCDYRDGVEAFAGLSGLLLTLELKSWGIVRSRI